MPANRTGLIHDVAADRAEIQRETLLALLYYARVVLPVHT
jgi:hypothetical protein